MVSQNQFLGLRKCYNINHSETSIQVVIIKTSTLYTVITPLQMNVKKIVFNLNKNLFNGWQLAEMKKSIPDMSLPWNL